MDQAVLKRCNYAFAAYFTAGLNTGRNTLEGVVRRFVCFLLDMQCGLTMDSEKGGGVEYQALRGVGVWVESRLPPPMLHTSVSRPPGVRNWLSGVWEGGLGQGVALRRTS